MTLTTALDGVVRDVTVLSNIAYMARGGSTSIFSQTYEGSSQRGTKLATVAIADFVHTFYDANDGPQLVRAVSTSARLYRAASVAFGTTLTWKPASGVAIGDKRHGIVDIEDYDNQMYARKADSLWAIKNDRAAKINVGLDDFPSTGIYSPMLAKELFLYLAWSYSLERLSAQSQLDDVGPWRGAGLPASRVGVVSCLEGVIGWLFAGIDAGSNGVSTVMAFDGQGWHEVFRAPRVGWRVQNIKWWAPAGVRGRLLVSCGGIVFAIAFPYRSLNPVLDSGSVGGIPLTYQHESLLETATIDMGVADLPKLFHQMYVRSKNLNSTGVEVRMDYQLDQEVGGSTWIELPEAFTDSPSQTVDVRQGEVRAARFRYRMRTANSSTPVHVQATVLTGQARTPIKRRWTLEAKYGTFQVDQQGSPDHDPSRLYMWLQDAAALSAPLHMRSAWPEMDDVWVTAEKPRLRRSYLTPDGAQGADYTLVLREL